jgi:hypothetical protein
MVGVARFESGTLFKTFVLVLVVVLEQFHAYFDYEDEDECDITKAVDALLRGDIEARSPWPETLLIPSKKGSL